MAEKLEVSQSLRGAFVITEGVIRRLCDHLLQATGSEVTVSVKLKGDRTISSTSHEVVLADSSLSRYNIDILKINSNNPYTRNSTYITLGYGANEPILLQIEGERSYVLSMEDTLKNEFDGARTSLSWILSIQQKASDFTFCMVIISASIFSFLIMSLLYQDEFSKYIPSYVLPTIVILFFGFNNIFPYLSPGIAFNFGKGKIRLSRKNGFLKLIIGGLVLSVIANGLTDFVRSIFFP